MTNLFSRANSIGLSYIREWLPDGKQDGHEWIAKNPTRVDNNLGSFRINLDSGVWSDFATGDKGGDAVSLYAYLNAFESESRADEKHYNNREGGIQAEAARAILEKHDPSYFPNDADDFTPKYKESNMPATPGKIKSDKKETGYWTGWHILENGMDNPPEFDPEYFINLWGPLVDKWTFENAQNKIVMLVARFKKEGEKKNDKPFTLWSKSSGSMQDIKWRAKALESLYPLWNLRGLLENQTRPVLLCEGQKAASRAHTILAETYCCVGWYGGAGAIKKTDLSPLTGRKVSFWPDADNAGRAVIEKLKELNCEVEIVHPPVNTKKGWDIADAIEEGWTVERLIDLIEKKVNNNLLNEVFIDDENMLPWRVLGMGGNNIWLYGRAPERAVSCPAKSLNKQFLYTIADKNKWAEFYAYDGKVSWDSAINDLLRKAERMPEFDGSKIRRCGAWKDDGRIVVNTGSSLIYDKHETQLSDIQSDFVYERSKSVPYKLEGALSVEESSKLIDILKLAPFEKDIYKTILAGWIALVPWGGILKWRPYVWMTGRKGSGKTWLIGNIVQPMVSRWSVSGSGGSNPAGWRQAIKNCSLGIIADEAEGENWKQSEKIEELLKMLRESSSGMTETNLSTLHGTSDGEGRQWQIRSMALLASIGAMLVHGADADRFTLLHLKTPDGDRDRFNDLIELAKLITPEWAEGFHARIYNIIDELLACIDIMVECVNKESGSSRVGDQLGTLLAAAYMVSHDKAIIKEEASSWLSSVGFNDILLEREEANDENDIISEILASKINVQNEYIRNTVTIGRALIQWFSYKAVPWIDREKIKDIPGLSEEAIKEALEQTGIKPSKHTGEWIAIAQGHPSIKKILEKTAYVHTYYQLLKRSPFTEPAECQGGFAGVQKKYIRMRAQELLEDVPI